LQSVAALHIASKRRRVGKAMRAHATCRHFRLKDFTLRREHTA
jgi:hypothetical protein